MSADICSDYPKLRYSIPYATDEVAYGSRISGPCTVALRLSAACYGSCYTVATLLSVIYRLDNIVKRGG